MIGTCSSAARATLDAWWCNLDDPPEHNERPEDDLSQEELVHASRLLTVSGRRRFIRRRAWLRRHLAGRLGRAPRDLPLTTNAFGKPLIADHTLAFSVSASRGIALLVLGEVETIGCDIEYRDPSFCFQQILPHCFSPAERAAFSHLPHGLRRAAFYHAWTCKEAYTKAMGLGLSLPLDSFEVDVSPLDPGRLMRGCEGFSVHAFQPKSDFHAAVVACGAWRFRLHPPTLS